LIGALALTTAACAKGTTVGPGDTDYTPPKASKSPTVKPTKVQSSEPAVKPTKVQTTPGVKAEVRKVAALDGNYYDTYDMQAKVGDSIVFENKSSEGPHSYTIAGTDIDSGPVEPGGEPYKVVVKLAEGTYDYKCSVVPYMVGGKLNVY